MASRVFAEMAMGCRSLSVILEQQHLHSGSIALIHSLTHRRSRHPEGLYVATTRPLRLHMSLAWLLSTTLDGLCNVTAEDEVVQKKGNVEPVA